MSTMYPPDHIPKLSATASTVEPKDYMATQPDKAVHLPSRKPTDSKMERFIGRGG
jgi:hypothetical protein